MPEIAPRNSGTVSRVATALPEGRELLPRDVAAYRALIFRLAKLRVNHEISNDHPVHASVLIEAMLDNAKQDVRIFTGRLAPRTYDQPGLVAAVKRFTLRPGVSLRILIQERMTVGDLSGSEFFNEIMTSKAVDTRLASGSYRESDANHFAVMDDVAYRYEVNHEDAAAVANFNDPATALKLISVFDQAFSMGKPLGEIP